MTTDKNELFGKLNLRWMAIGAVVILAGILLMAGGKSTDPNVFSDNEVYSFRRITLAPLLIIAGLLIEVYAIMKKSSGNRTSHSPTANCKRCQVSPSG
jgi:hypothetical protein